MTEQPSYDPDPQHHLMIAEAIARLAEHVEHVLGSDPGCGLCLWCSTCQVRIIATDLLGDVLDRGWFRHPRFGNGPGTWPPPRPASASRRPTPPPLTLLGRTPRAER